MTDVEIINLALDYGMKPVGRNGRQVLAFPPDELYRFARLLIRNERESCACLVDSIRDKCIDEDVDDPSLTMISFWIRERGEK